MYSSVISVNGLNSANTGAQVSVTAQSNGNWVDISVKDSSQNLIAGISMDSSTGRVNITGTGVYFNGTKKW